MKKKSKEIELGDLKIPFTQSLSETPLGPCPSLEDISSLIDGNITDGKKDILMKHIVTCDNCYQVFKISSKLIWDSNTRSDPSYLPRMLSFAATVIVGIVSIYLYFYIDSYRLPPTPQESLDYQFSKAKQEEEQKILNEVKKAHHPPPHTVRTRSVSKDLLKESDTIVQAPLRAVPFVDKKIKRENSSRQKKKEKPKMVTEQEKSAPIVGGINADKASKREGKKIKTGKKGGKRITAPVTYKTTIESITPTSQLFDHFAAEFKKINILKTGDEEVKDREKFASLPKKTDITPFDIIKFLDKSKTGTLEYRFFNLIKSGWYYQDNLYSANGILPEWLIKDLSKEKKREIIQKSINQWEDLLRNLSDLPLQIANNTLKNLNLLIK